MEEDGKTDIYVSKGTFKMSRSDASLMADSSKYN